MKKLRRLLLRIMLIIIVSIFGIATIKYIRYSSQQIKVSAIDEITIPENVVLRFAKGIQLPTISYENKIDTIAFHHFNDFIQNQYIYVDSLLEKIKINDFSHVWKYPGKNPKLEPILLMGHLDVVPVETESLKDWDLPPFDGAMQEGYVWGRGTLDDKIGVLGILEAVELLLKVGYYPERTIYLAFGHDEETGGQHGAQQIAAYFENKNIHFEYVLDEGGIILENALSGLEAPLATIGIAEKGYATLRLTVDIPEGGHSSMPPTQTAIGILSQAIVDLNANPPEAKISGINRQFFDYIGPEMGLFKKIIFANLWLTESLVIRDMNQKTAARALLRTTVAPTVIEGGIRSNVLPTNASVSINFRILPDETIESVIQYVEKTLNNSFIRISKDTESHFFSNPSAISDTNAFGFEIIQKTVKEVFPEAIVAPTLTIAGTDSRHYESVSNHIYRFLPVRLQHADLTRIHGINERIGIEQYKDAIRFYHQLILNSCK